MLLAAEAVVQPESSCELTHLVALAGTDERHTDSALAGATSSPDPVDVRVVVGRRVKVDHV
jgi:hypothetical protein